MDMCVGMGMRVRMSMCVRMGVCVRMAACFLWQETCMAGKNGGFGQQERSQPVAAPMS